MKSRIIALVILFLVSFGDLKAQIASGQLNPSLDIRPFMSFNVEVNPSVDLNFLFESITDMQNGKVKNGAFEVKVKSNQNWQMSISAVSPIFSPLSGSTGTLLSSILGLRKQGNASFVSLAASPTQIASGNRGANTQVGNTFSLDLQAKPGLTYDGGSYACVIMFTISAD